MLAAATAAAAADTPPDSTTKTSAADSVASATDSVAARPPSAPARITESQVLDLGLENVRVDPADPSHVGFENRRYRHTAQVLGMLDRAAGAPVVGFEERLGLAGAALTRRGTAEKPRFGVSYPSDSDFPARPRGTRASPTTKSVDFLVGALFGFELGHLTSPVEFQIQLEPMVRYNPWTGGRATASLVIPLYNDFLFDDLHPDVDNVRPGLVSLEQFAWVPRAALTTATAGLLGDNRYGFSIGAARPIASGALLLDTQADLTGFISFDSDGVVYSDMKQHSGFVGLTYRPPAYDVALRLRVEQFLYGDRGVEFEFKRSFGDLDFALFGQHTHGRNIEGVRITLPVPPMTRPTQRAVRVLPVARFPFTYRTETEPLGLHLTGVASREDFLRQLSAPALEANRDRYAPPSERRRAQPDERPVDWTTLTGTSGFIVTPWAGTMRDRGIELGYSHIPKKWAFEQFNRTHQHEEEPYYLTLGILPRLEASLRFTRIPGRKGFLPDDPDNQLTTDTDHMASGRLTLLTSRPKRPGVAIGVDDVEGTRRFHSSYLVTGMPFAIFHLQNRLSLGYAPSVFTATHHVLEGGFGAFEVSPWRAVAARVEYDSEKWNAGFGVDLIYGLRLRAAALNMESLSVGASWFHEL
jgi:hypothetical protein